MKFFLDTANWEKARDPLGDVFRPAATRDPRR